VQQVARALDAGRSVPSEAFSVCNVAAPEMLWQAVDDLIQLLGRRGYDETSQTRNLARDARALRGCEGPTEIMTGRLGARLLGSGGDSVRKLVVEILGAPAAAPLIDQAVSAVRARLNKSSVGSPADAIYWSNARAGEMTTWIVLLAAVEGSRQQAPSPDLDRAAAWARSNFESALSLMASDLPLPTTGQDAVTEAVAAYSRSIGEANPLLLWDEHALQPSVPPPPRNASQPPPAAGSMQGSELERSVTAEMAQRLGLNATPASWRVGRELRGWIVSWLAQRLRVAESQIDPRRSFADHGLDSLAAVELAKALSDRLGLLMEETLLWDFATIDALVDHLDGAAPASEAPRSAGQRSAPPSRPSSSEGGESNLEDEIARLERELRQR